MRFKCKCGTIGEMADEEIEKILVMHKLQKEEKDKNNNALQEVAKAVATLEEQLNSLKTNVKGLEDKIRESDTKINEEVIIS